MQKLIIYFSFDENLYSSKALVNSKLVYSEHISPGSELLVNDFKVSFFIMNNKLDTGVTIFGKNYSTFSSADYFSFIQLLNELNSKTIEQKKFILDSI